MKLHLVKQFDNSFKLAFDSDYEKAKKIKVGEVYQYETKNSRNIKHHRKFWALIDLVYNNQEYYNNKDHLRKDLTIAAGFYTQRKNMKGEVVAEANSISFANMDQFEFNEFYERILDTIVKYFGFEKQAVEEEILKHF